MTMSTPSPQLTREEELALWREKRKSKGEKAAASKTPKFRARNSSTSSENDGVKSAPRYSAATISYRRGSSFRRSSISSSQQDSPFIATPRLSSNVSRRKPPRDMSTASSRLKQKSSLSVRKIQTTTRTPQEMHSSSRRPRKSLSANMYLTNRPSPLLSMSADFEKENTTSRVNQIRSRAARKREQLDGEDESSKPESKTTTYRTPLTYGDSEATAQEPISTCSKLASFHSAMNDNESKPGGILDISISLPFKDVMSPLSTTSIAASPASTISSNGMEKQTKSKSESSMCDSKHESEPTRTAVADNPTKHKSSVSPPQDVVQCIGVSSAPIRTASIASDTRKNDDDVELCVETAPLDNKNNVAVTTSLDFQGIEYDDSSQEEPPLDVRKRRRRDSTYMRLPTPEPPCVEKRQSLSPPSAKSAFVPVARRSTTQLVENKSPLEENESQDLCDSNNSVAIDERMESSPADTQSMQDPNEAEVTLSLTHNVARVNDRAILEAIPESCDSRTKSSAHEMQDSSQLQLENQALIHEQVEALRIANCNLEKKLHVIRHAYEERVTPFRDVFEDVSS